MTINDKLLSLRSIMKESGIDAIIIPSSDPHQSEYVAAHWQERTWISGFTGSAGTVVITEDHAGLWTDSRYFLQAEMELDGSEFQLHKMLNQFAAPYVDFLSENLHKGHVVAINGLMFSKSSVDSIKNTLEPLGIIVEHRHDMISQVWSDRPSLSLAPIHVHDVSFAGKTVEEKLSDIRQKITESRANHHFISALDDLAWTFNIRGNDVDYNPVVIAYAIVSNVDAHLFVDPNKLNQDIISYFTNNNVIVHSYNDIIPFLNNLSEKETIIVDPNICSQTVYEAINAQIKHDASIPKLLKAVKNPTEIAHIRNAMKKDGAAIANTFYWLEHSLADQSIVDECAVALKLAENRSKQEHYHGESFGAIIGYKGNGAIIHYHPEPDTCKKINAEGILLVDSGGQYSDGTTDITRTLSLSEPTSEQKKHYTLILKGMIALSRAVFPEGTTGVQLDTLARQFLWSEGLNYGHGTGHGVGFFLNVHEPPQGFAPAHSERGRTVHVEGMLSSNEPGYYLEGQYGMRIENLIVVNKFKDSGFLSFETLTLYPFDKTLLDHNRLTVEEKTWINDYHKKVWDSVSPLLSGEIKTWFKEKCDPVD